jgi:hypothetical protein
MNYGSFFGRGAFIREWQDSGTVHQLFLNFKKAYDSVRRDVVSIILTKFVIPMTQVRLSKIYLNETCNKVCTSSRNASYVIL